ncbi:polysaccharide biosynthesis protein [Aquihabitans sp. G128]|uniref:polysaccharide biosynthesis protein n=1 Tax=Aquihabitans sp. G128 TaxID=2849779 RepID=UPI001C2415BB|nr:nucleoside-diphosphate sugar epimerase/dehydratase [Aquihabitans sp. G128]QXC61326.1 polysaccharide biosynthesis protein [Aquihabitans sp. G128]
MEPGAGQEGPSEAASASGPRTASLSVALRLSSIAARRRIQAVAGASAMAGSIVVATYLRYEFSVGHGEHLRHLLLFALYGAVIFVVVGTLRGLYSGKRSFGSFEELSTLVEAILGTTLVLLVLDLALGRYVPMSVPLLASTLVLTASAGVRYVWRWYLEQRLRPTSDDLERVVVIGAGEGGQQIVTAMLRNPSGRYLPVALLDDDPMKRNLRIRGVPVRGGHDQIESVADSVRATVALLAIPSAGSSLIRDVEERAGRAGLRLLVLPASSELYGAEVGVSDIRPVTPVDLLGRHEHDSDLGAIAGYVTGKRVLVTGAGGSIGSELCRQIYRFAPASLVMLERDESALHAVQLSIEGRAMLDSRNLVVADIRDHARIQQVFAEHRPEVVFHAAALKHLPLLEMHPSEALKTNVWGTVALLQASRAVGVERFVNISTDKAADPISVLGYTKRLAERLTAHAANGVDGTYLSVRFGNVLGSRGSVLTAFTAQIEAGGPVTVTDPDVTRYFMTVEEAVQLVIQAGAVGQPGEALVLDMGEPVRIDDVARRLIAEADRPIDIVYTGLRPGEKLHEILFAADEDDARPSHPGISHVRVPPLDPEQLPTVDRDGFDLTRVLAETCELPDLSRDPDRSSLRRFAS